MNPADQYRKIAAELRAKAAREKNGRLATEWAHLARCYLRLAEQADQNSFADIWFESGPKASLGSESA
jgi:hypothetical protein